MILYGTKLHTDFAMPYRLPMEGESRGAVELKHGIPPDLRSKATIGTLLYKHYHGRRIFFYSSRRPFEEPFQTGDILGYEAEGAVRFFWRYGEEKIYYERLKEGDDWRVAFWFIHPFFPLYLTLEKRFVMLHCSAVEIDGRAVAFIAPYHAGKSTLAAALLERGHRLITDDVLPSWQQNDRIFCAPSHPHYRPLRGQETLGHYTEHFVKEFKRIEKIYLLEEKNESDRTTTIDPVGGIERFLSLKHHSVLHTLKSLETIHDRHILKLADRTPVYRLKRQWGLEAIQSVCATIENHIGDIQ